MTLDDLVARMCKAQHWTSSQTGPGWGIEIPQPKGRSQTVFASVFMDEGSPIVRYLSMVGDADSIDGNRSKMALELNARMPHGCLAIHSGHLVVTDTRPLNTTTPETSAVAVKYIAQQADTYERLIYSSDKH